MSISNFFIMRELDKKIREYDKYGMKEMIEEYRRLIKHAAYFKYTSLQYAYLAYMDAKDILKMKMMRLSKLYPETRDNNIFKKIRLLFLEIIHPIYLEKPLITNFLVSLY